MAEIELKLRIEKSVVPRAAILLERLSGRAPVRQHLSADYYDTTSKKLLRHGYTIRVGREDGKLVQTVKHSNPKTGDALQRDEWASELATPRPNLARGAGGRRIRAKFGDVKLAHQFTVDVHRRVFAIRPANGTLIEAALDVGAITRKGKVLDRMVEIELELKKGRERILYALATRLNTSIGATIEVLSKAERGFQQMGYNPGPVKAMPPCFDRDQTLAMALQAAARRYFAQYQRNLGAMRTKPDAAVHQMRVAIRRLRSALFAAEKYIRPGEYEHVNKLLNSLLQGLGDARDLTVLVHRLQRVPELPLRRTASHRRMVDAVKTRKSRAVARTRTVVSSTAHTMSWLRVMTWFESLDRDLRTSPRLRVKLDKAVPDILDRLFKKIRKRGRRFAGLAATDRHKFRIACKKLRYAIDLFSSLYNEKEMAKFVHLLERVQDDLGALNDAHIARGLLMHVDQSKEVSASAGEALGWIERSAHPKLAAATRHVRRLRRSGAYW